MMESTSIRLPTLTVDSNTGSPWSRHYPSTRRVKAVEAGQRLQKDGELEERIRPRNNEKAKALGDTGTMYERRWT